MLRRLMLMLALPMASAFVPAGRVISRGLAMMSSKKSLNLPIIEPALFEEFNLFEDKESTKVCQSLHSMEKVRICEDPVIEAWCTTNGQSLLLGDEFCSDVLFIRSFYENLFQTIRQNRRVVLTGRSGTSKSV